MFSMAESSSSDACDSESTSMHQALALYQASLGSTKPITDDPSSVVDLIAFQNRCDEYNRLLPFARSPPSATSAVSVDNTIDELNLFPMDIRERLAAKYSLLDEAFDGFKDSISRCPEENYESGDLLCMSTFRNGSCKR